MIQLFCQAEEHRFIARRVLANALVCYAFSFVAVLLLLPLAVRCAYSPAGAAISAVAYVLLVVGIAGVTAELQFSRFRGQFPLPKRAIVLALLRVIPWLIPLVVLCMRGTMAGILGVGAFAIVSAKLLRRLWKLHGVDATEIRAVRSRDTGVNLPALTALICVAYFGVAAGLNGNTIIAVSCTAASCFLIGWLEDRYSQSGEQFRNGVVPILLAIVITFIGLLPPLGHLQETSAKLDPLQSGVILLTERKPPIPLILPQPEDRLRIRKKRFPPTVASILFSGEYWTGRKAIELGLADGIGDLRSVLRQRYGDKVQIALVAAERSLLGRARPGIGLSGRGLDLATGRLDLGRLDLAGDIVSALETRALWARYGL